MAVKVLLIFLNGVAARSIMALDGHGHIYTKLFADQIICALVSGEIGVPAADRRCYLYGLRMQIICNEVPVSP